jgi:hypothetical protein
MKIDNETTTFIKNIVKTAQMVDIDNIIIESDLVRAIDDNQTVVLLQSENIPEIPFGAIGLNRTNILLSRLSLVEGSDGFSIDAELDGDNVSKLSLKSNNAKVEYRCANPTTIRAPRKVADTLKYRVKLNAEAVNLLQKAASAMPQNADIDVVTIISDGKSVAFELSDATNDAFSHTFSTVTCLEDEDGGRFAHRYPLKNIISLFKNCPDGFFDVGQKGIMKIAINGVDLYVLPQV